MRTIIVDDDLLNRVFQDLAFMRFTTPPRNKQEFDLWNSLLDVFGDLLDGKGERMYMRVIKT